MKDFTLVQFGNSQLVDWYQGIVFDENTNDLKISFLSSYITKKCNQFHEIVRLKKDPDREWITCIIIYNVYYLKDKLVKYYEL